MAKGGGGGAEIKETPYEKENWKANAERWNIYYSKFRPLEKKLINELSGNQDGREDRVQGQINADLAQKVGTMTPEIDPSAGRVVVPMQAGLSEVASRARAAGTRAVRQQRLAGLQTLVDIGRGQNSEAQLGEEQLASAAVKKAIGKAEDDEYSSASTANAAGSAIGGGISLYRNVRGKAAA